MQRRIPINRLNKFFSGEDFNLEIRMGREALEGDNNSTVVLYRVDRKNTQSDDIYGESAKDNIRYLPPVELFVASFKIDETENKAYNAQQGNIRYAQQGNLKFNIYSDHLAELDVEISFGDYIGFAVNETKMIYYAVVNDGLKNFDNAHSMMGYKGFYRTIICAAIDEEEFKGF